MNRTESNSVDITLGGATYALPLKILGKYNVAGPRYTSYPTAPEWSDDFGVSDYERAMVVANEIGERRPVSLYLHIPFCEQLCLYCGCNVIINSRKEVARPYLDRLKREIDSIGEKVDRTRPVVQMHWGGGTPTYLSVDQIEELCAHIRGRFTFDADAEISIEIDPVVTTAEQMTCLRRLGFNRVSMGVQDFNPEVQQAVRRIQSFEQTRDLVNVCRDLSYDSINLDMIYGLPCQTPESFTDSVTQVLELNPDRVAMYSYAHVPWMKKAQSVFADKIPHGLEKFRIFQSGIRGFDGAGYDYIGLDHFSKPDDELAVALRDGSLHRNFQGYSTRASVDLYGMGVSSISGIYKVYAQNHRESKEYGESIDSGTLPTLRGLHLSEDDVIRREIISMVLCHRVVDKSKVRESLGVEFDEYFEPEVPALEDLAKDGLIEWTESGFKATPIGYIFLRNIAMVFDRYLREKKADGPLFSKTL